MSEDLEESDNEDAPAEAVDVQAEGEEVRLNDEAAARTSRRVIKVVNKEIIERQKYIVKQVRRHMGHLHKEDLVRVFISGGALPELVKYVQDEFKCEECEATTRPPVRRGVAVPRTFAFNCLLSMDTFFMTLWNLPVPIQRIICQGTHYMVLSILYSHHPLDQEEV